MKLQAIGEKFQMRYGQRDGTQIDAIVECVVIDDDATHAGFLATIKEGDRIKYRKIWPSRADAVNWAGAVMQEPPPSPPERMRR